MKNVKKIFALALALIMVLGLATTAAAADIKIVASSDGSAVTEHTYAVYQIFKGDLEELEGNTVLTNIVYGANYNGDGEKTLEDLLAALALMDGEKAAKYIEADITGDPVATLDKTNNHEVKNLAVGYYLIIDVSDDLPENETASAFILEVLDNVEIKSKHTSGPIVVKKIADVNDSVDVIGEDTEIQWHDSADHDIGDAIPFKLQMTVPSAFQLFEDNKVAYPFTFHDTEEPGLDFNGITSVYVLNDTGKTVLTADDYTLVDPATDGHTFDVVFADLTAIESVKVGSVIVVEYTSILTKDAVLGNQGNVNEVFGEFRNYYEPTVPVFTPKDAVIAFTYKVVVNKVDEEGEALSGAVFTLEKFVASANGTVEYPANSDIMGEWVAKSTVETNPNTTFTFKGLDDGNYRLTETEAPEGYNAIDPIYFTVTADHNVVWENTERTDVLTSLTGNVATGEIKFTAKENNSTLSTDVENKKGTVLPETGGIGTKIFYIAGGALAVVAVVLLITKKRMTSK